MTAEGTSGQMSMSQHPDIVGLRERYEAAAETPQAWAVEGLAFLAGGFVAISPWVVGFNGNAPALAATDLIVGGLCALLALALASFYERSHGLAWVMPAMGLWLILAPWLVNGVDTTGSMITSHILAGGCVVLFGLALTGMTRMPNIRRPSR